MQHSDEQLTLSAFGGDEKAFAELYARYHRHIYDFVIRMVRDRDVADDLVQSTFVKAWESLQKRKVTGNIKAWLYTIARNTSINELKRQKWVMPRRVRNAEGSDPLEYSVVDSSRLSDPQGALEDAELVDLVWSSATALSRKDYALLDLHLRKGLSIQELASVFGVRRNNMNTMLYRLRHSLEESVVATVLLRRGRRDCPVLDALVAEGPVDEPNPPMRRAIVKHLEVCYRCQESKERYTSPVEIFSGLALIPVSSELQAANWRAVSTRMRSADAGEGSLVQASKQLLRRWARAPVAFKAITLAIFAAVVGLPLALAFVVARDSNAISQPAEPSSTPVQAVREAAPVPDSLQTPGLRVVAVRVESPASVSQGEMFSIFTRADLLNGGPAETLRADTTFSVLAPADCSVAPDAPVTHQDTSFPRNVDVSIARGWEVICSRSGGHDFTVSVTAAIDASEPVTDPDLTDNTNSGTKTTEVLPR